MFRKVGGCSDPKPMSKSASLHLGLDLRQGLDLDFLHRSSDEVILRIMNVLDMWLEGMHDLFLKLG
jgi:hypothetical protein